MKGCICHHTVWVHIKLGGYIPLFTGIIWCGLNCEAIVVDAWWLVVWWWYHPICLYSCLCDVCAMSASSLVSLSSCLPFQKAGFLYIEQAFAWSDMVFRRRVVLAVSSAHIHRHTSVYPLPHLCPTLVPPPAPPPLPDRNAWTHLVALSDSSSLGLPFLLSTTVTSNSSGRTQTTCFGSLEWVGGSCTTSLWCILCCCCCCFCFSDANLLLMSPNSLPLQAIQLLFLEDCWLGAKCNWEQCQSSSTHLLWG